MDARKTEAVVLRTIPFRDSSLIVSCFSLTYGKFTLLARGARRVKSAFHGYFHPAAYIELQYTYKESREIQTATYVAFSNPYYDIFSDIEKTAFVYAICELLYKTLKENEPLPDVFHGLLSALNEFNTGRITPRATFVKFLITLASGLGFLINTNSCQKCHKKIIHGMYDLKTGVLICEQCSTSVSDYLIVSPTHLKAIRMESELENYKQDSLLFLQKLMLAHLSIHTEQHIYLKSLEILNKIDNRKR